MEDRMKQHKHLIQITEDCIKIANELGWSSESKSAWEKKNEELRHIVFHKLRKDKVTPLKKAILQMFMEETKDKSTEKYDSGGKLKVKKDNISTSELEKFMESLKAATKTK